MQTDAEKTENRRIRFLSDAPASFSSLSSIKLYRFKSPVRLTKSEPGRSAGENAETISSEYRESL